MYFTAKAFFYLRRIAFFDNLEASTFSSLKLSNYLFEKIRYRNGPHSLRHFRQDAVFMASCTASSSATLASQRAAEVSGNDESSGMLNRKMLFPESVNQEPPLACVFWFKSSGGEGFGWCSVRKGSFATESCCCRMAASLTTLPPSSRREPRGPPQRSARPIDMDHRAAVARGGHGGRDSAASGRPRGR